MQTIIDLFEHHHPKAFDQFLLKKSLSNHQVTNTFSKSKSGEDTLFFEYNQTLYQVHSRYHPTKEAKKQAGLLDQAEENIFLFFGMGLGYLPEELLKHKTTKHCSLWIPDAITFENTLVIRDISVMINDSRWEPFFTFDRDAILIHLQSLTWKFPRAKVHLIETPGYTNVYTKEYTHFLEAYQLHQKTNSLIDQAFQNDLNEIISVLGPELKSQKLLTEAILTHFFYGVSNPNDLCRTFILLDHLKNIKNNSLRKEALT